MSHTMMNIFNNIYVYLEKKENYFINFFPLYQLLCYSEGMKCKIQLLYICINVIKFTKLENG